MKTLNGGIGLGPTADIDFGNRMNSLEEKLAVLRSSGVLNKGPLGRVVSTAAQLKSATAAQLGVTQSSEKKPLKALADDAKLSSLESRLLCTAKVLSKEGDTLRGAALIRETAAAQANAAATVLQIESAGPLALRAAVAAEACAAAELAASKFSRAPASTSPLRSRLGIYPVVDQAAAEELSAKDTATMLDAGMKPMGPWWAAETPKRAASTSPIRAPKQDAAPRSPGPSSSLVSAATRPMVSPGLSASLRTLGTSASARELAPYRSIAGEPVLAPSPVQALQAALAADHFGQTKPKSMFQTKLDEKLNVENPDSNAVDFYTRRNQMISARNEVNKLTAQLEAARQEVKRLEAQQAVDKKERNELRQIDKDEVKDLKVADRAAVAHLHKQHHEYTNIIGHVPHSGVDMAAKIMKDSFARVEKEVADDLVTPNVAAAMAVNTETDYMRSRASEAERPSSYTMGNSSLRKTDANLRSGASPLFDRNHSDFGSRRDDSNAPWRQFAPNAPPASHGRRLFST